MRCLITGGYGYVGAHVAARAAAAGHEVVVLSRGPARPAPFAHKHVAADLAALSPSELSALLPEGIDACIHLAGRNHSDDPDHPRKSLQANALGTRNLLEALLLRPNRPHVVYSGTFHVYGRTGGEIDETTPPAPRNDYALTHLFAEEYGRMFARTEGLLFSVLRLTNGYGAPLLPESDKWHLLCNDLCRQAVREGSITLKAHPETQRDFVPLRDVAGAFTALLNRPDLAGRTYNIASGRAATLGEVARIAQHTAETLLGREVPLIFNNTGEAPAGEPLRVSNAAARRDLDFTCSPDMEAEMRKILAAVEAEA